MAMTKRGEIGIEPWTRHLGGAPLQFGWRHRNREVSVYGDVGESEGIFERSLAKCETMGLGGKVSARRGHERLVVICWKWFKSFMAFWSTFEDRNDV